MLDDFAATLRAAQAGEEWAVACLWRVLQPRLLGFLRARSRELADDVASETWLRAARDLASFRGGASDFRAWMFTIARHALIDAQRHARRRPSDPTDPADLVDSPTASDPAAEAMERLDTERALHLIGTLPDDQAEVILLRVVAGLDTPRVAAMLGKKAGTIRVLQHRGLRRLAEMLGSKEPATENDVTP